MTNVAVAGVAFRSHGRVKARRTGRRVRFVVDVARGQLATVDRNGYIGRTQPSI